MFKPLRMRSSKHHFFIASNLSHSSTILGRVHCPLCQSPLVQQWEASIERKINIASRVYDMLYRIISNKRTELLEAVIIFLIALEIVLFLMHKL